MLAEHWHSIGNPSEELTKVLENLLVVFTAPFETLRKAVGKISLKLLEALKSNGNEHYFSTNGFIMENDIQVCLSLKLSALTTNLLPSSLIIIKSVFFFLL